MSIRLPTHFYVGNKVCLRAVTLEDCTPAYVAWLNDEEVTRYLETRWSEQTQESIQAFVGSMMNSKDSHLLAIIAKDTMRHVGNLKIGPINKYHLYADISYFIGEKSYWGKGLATEAVRAATAWAFNFLGVESLRAGAYEGNMGSKKVLERCGYTKRAVFPDELVAADKREAHLYYSITRREYLERTAPVVSLALVDPSNEDAVAFLYDLLKERPRDANISHRQLPSLEQHNRFVRSNPYAVWYIIMDGNTSVGSVYLTKQDELGIFIAKASQRRGYAETALAEIMRIHPRERYLANVAPNNMPSHALFTKLGGSVIQHTYELRSEAVAFPQLTTATM